MGHFQNFLLFFDIKAAQNTPNSAVIQIVWTGKDLIGAISSTYVSLLSSLNWLQLNQNKIQGDLSFMTSLPVSLVHLDLNSNEISGIIPSINPSLTYLALYSNFLSGTIPTFPAGLTVFKVSLNNLMGDVPLFPDSLVDLQMQNNYLTGTVFLTKPQVVFMDNTQISGLIISDISSITGCNLANSLLYASEVSYLASKCDISGIKLTRSHITTKSTRFTSITVKGIITSTIATSRSYLLTSSNSLFLKATVVNQLTGSNTKGSGTSTTSNLAIMSATKEYATDRASKSSLTLNPEFTSFNNSDINESYYKSQVAFDDYSQSYNIFTDLSTTTTLATDLTLANSADAQFNILDYIYLYAALCGFAALVIALLVASRFVKNPTSKSKYGRKNSFGTLNTVVTKDK